MPNPFCPEWHQTCGTRRKMQRDQGDTGLNDSDVFSQTGLDKVTGEREVAWESSFVAFRKFISSLSFSHEDSGTGPSMSH